MRNLGNDKPIYLFAGPCQIESEQHALDMALALKGLAKAQDMPFVFKASFDKANRTSYDSPRGIGLDKAIRVFEQINYLGIQTMTDVHEPWQCEKLKDVINVFQIPALLSRQTDLIEAAVLTGKPVNIKKGQFMSPWEARAAGNKAREIAKLHILNTTIMLTERGNTFGYNALVNDFKGVELMKVASREDPAFPVIFDATHSVQMPGILGNRSGGDRTYVETLAKAAVAVGVAGIFIETHDDPENALSDGPCMVHLEHMDALLRKLKAIDAVVK